ncbi:Recombinase XerD [Pontimonas salivibrio]|uniref:Tyrosine recombinase XerC n=1 Tax=Pontimonas salivibrio TaxID=1159327 RepID=A0A2L2BR42_9MICO|nr:site-specific tyrosine recombinase XerD [Pontimonas salivibrio]AVG24136.1 Recombinase XerD [Pontimonas salivibrio]
MSTNSPNQPSPPPGPVGIEGERFLRYLSLERGRSANTLIAYRKDLESYGDFLQAQGVTELSLISREHVAEFARGLTGSPRSVQRRLSSIRSFHRYLMEVGHTQSNPAAEVKGPQQPERLPKALSVHRVTTLLEGVSGDDALSLRDRAVLEVLYGTGARVSEVVNLAVDDVTGIDGVTPEVIRVIGKGDKERIVPLGSKAREALEAYLVRSRPFLARKARRSSAALFLGARGAGLSRQSVWLILRARAEAAGITEPLSPHTLRHSCATHLIAGGADIRVVQELLGHQSVQTTQIYTRVTIDSLRDVYYSSHPRATG